MSMMRITEETVPSWRRTRRRFDFLRKAGQQRALVMTRVKVERQPRKVQNISNSISLYFTLVSSQRSG